MEKGKRSTRSYRRSSYKNDVSSPALVSTSSAPVENRLPPNLRDCQDLPVLPSQQESNLPQAQFQSIAESGVLAESLRRSREKWLTECVFERYWAKPSRKRTSIDVKNPAKETMSRLGACSMIIDPHVFETTLYTVKDPPPVNPVSSPQLSSRPPDMRYSSFSHISIQPLSPFNTATPSLHVQSQNQSMPSQPTLPPFKEAFARFEPQGPSSYQNSAIPASSHATISRSSYDHANMDNAKPDNFKANDEKLNPDPVIQMLAARAASNHNLKSLMKVVASGNATQKQLADFQSYIDELNDVIKSRNSTSHVTSPLPSVTAISNPSTLSQTQPSSLAVSTRPLPNYTDPQVPRSASELARQEPPTSYYSHYSQPAKPRTQISHRSDISAIVFDIGGSGDRFSFPRLSILEYLPGGTQVLVSFLIIRKGSEAACKGYKDTASYYQPITMRLSTSQPRILEPLARVVASQEEVRKYMNSVFDRMLPAQNAFLVTRLPRSMDSIEVEKEISVTPSERKVIQTIYSPPNSLVPLVISK